MPPLLTEAYSAGFFAAIISGPMVMPGEWLGRFTDAAPRESPSEFNAFAERIMGRYDEIATLLHEDPPGFIDHVAAICAADESGAALLQLVRGFLDAIDLRHDAWKAFADAARSEDLFAPLGAASDMASNPSKREWLKDLDLRTNLAHE